MSDTQTRHVLTDEQMATIAFNIGAAADVVELFDAYFGDVWKLLVGAEAWDALQPGELHPMEHAIPQDQTETILAMTVARATTLLPQHQDAGVQFLLNWMNIGPSSYDR